MIATQYIQKHYQRWLVDPVLKRISPHYSPIRVTLLAGFIGVAIFPALKFNRPLLATLLLLLSGFLDTLDGALARKQGTATEWGAVLDIFVDRIVESAVILGLFSVDPLHRGWICLLMLCSILLCITSFLVVGIFTRNDSSKSFHYSPGLIERTEAFLFFLLMIWCPTYIVGLALAFTILTLWTAFFRIKQFAGSHRLSFRELNT